MVFKAIGLATDNLDNAIDQYGFFGDTVLILGSVLNAQFATYEGNDFVYGARVLDPLAIIFANLGSGNDTYTGSAGRDVVTDGSGNDNVSLAAGNDAVLVCAGDDTYNGGIGFDELSFAFASNDGLSPQTPNSQSIRCDLSLTTRQNLGSFGNDVLLGFERVTGGLGNDVLFGSAAGNTLNGNAGNDFLDGRNGSDLLEGGEGADTLIGGAGGDALLAGNGTIVGELTPARDIIRYLSITDSRFSGSARDEIYYFDRGSAATDDRIDLSAIDATPAVAGNQAFVFKGAAAFTNAGGEVRVLVSGTDTIVYVDTDADAASEMQIRVINVTGLTAVDFIL